MEEKPSLAIICVKNYDIESAIEDLRPVIAPGTILLPLQNGIYAFQRFCEAFPENIVLKGYIQGPNTIMDGENLLFTNAGVTHIGASSYSGDDIVQHVYRLMHSTGLDVIVEVDIDKMVWKKWMLNVAGNSVTALTGADYSKFRTYEALQTICRKSMREFVEVAQAKEIPLFEEDIEDIIQYYVSYKGAKERSFYAGGCASSQKNRKRISGRYTFANGRERTDPGSGNRDFVSPDESKRRNLPE